MAAQAILAFKPTMLSLIWGFDVSDTVMIITYL